MGDFANLENTILLGNFKEKYHAFQVAKAVTGINAKPRNNTYGRRISRARFSLAFAEPWAVGLRQGPWS